MRILNPKTGESALNEYCHGCYCHDMAMQFGLGEPPDGVVHFCPECGCPKTEIGFERWRAQGRAILPAESGDERRAPAGGADPRLPG